MKNTVSLPSDYQSFIHQSRYSKYIDDLGRRETWGETVDRYISNVVAPALHKTLPYFEARETQNELREAILNLEVMPSMRCLMAAGPGLTRSNVAGYNCAYTAASHQRVFDEVLYILMCGTGVGYSVERQYTEQLPKLPTVNNGDIDMTIVVEDSKEGWADAFRQLIEELYLGNVPSWDVSQVRAAGERLMTFGGRASGPGPLVELFEHTVQTFRIASDMGLTRLSPVQVHSILTMVGSVVVVGGVRRSAMISLSDLDDDEMRLAKSGEWWKYNPHFALANNSVAFDGTPDRALFDLEWASLEASGSGERGIYNRQAVKDKCIREGIREPADFGTNPCSEINLLPGGQFCNLTSVVARATDTPKTLARKIRVATIMGTIQATLTHFPYLRRIWKENTEQEALLGVSITGIMDCKFLNGAIAALPRTLEYLRKIAVTTNLEYADILGINPSAAVTCVKPEGTSSQLNNSSSGIHPRHSEYYIRTVRADTKDPITAFMIDQGIPNEPCAMKPETTVVFSFPVMSPVGAVTRNDQTAIEQLELWLTYQRHFTCHKPSITVSVSDDEWSTVGDWVYDHFGEMSGVSFLPRSNHTYAQAPYQDCTEDEYYDAMLDFPRYIDWDDLAGYERGDTTVGSQTFACTGDSCEMVDLTS